MAARKNMQRQLSGYAVYTTKNLMLILSVILCFGWMTPKNPKPVFSIHETEQGIALAEHGKPVFFYQRKPKLSGEKYSYNNYLHPLYNLEGDTLTEEFPEDHIYHRGIFWAWHQVYLKDRKIGDSWMMENMSQDVVSLKSIILEKEFRLQLNLLWHSTALENKQPFLVENTTITVHQLQKGIRMIDFEIALKALIPGVSLGGSEDEKGYGGFCARIKLPANLSFTGKNGPVMPKEGQVIAGEWMDFSANFDHAKKNKTGLTILCHQTTPNYPAPWILRQTGSMQNIVFPGTHRMELPVQSPIILKYRLLIHNGDANSLNIQEQQAAYEKYN